MVGLLKKEIGHTLKRSANGLHCLYALTHHVQTCVHGCEKSPGKWGMPDPCRLHRLVGEHPASTGWRALDEATCGGAHFRAFMCAGRAPQYFLNTVGERGVLPYVHVPESTKGILFSAVSTQVRA